MGVHTSNLLLLPPSSSAKEISLFPSEIWFLLFAFSLLRLLPVLWLLALLSPPLFLPLSTSLPRLFFPLVGTQAQAGYCSQRDAAAEMICACLPAAEACSQSTHHHHMTRRPRADPSSFNAADMWVTFLTGPTCQPSGLGRSHVHTRRRIPWGLVGPRLLTGQIRGARCPACVGGLGYCSPPLALHAAAWSRARSRPTPQRVRSGGGGFRVCPLFLPHLGTRDSNTGGGAGARKRRSCPWAGLDLGACFEAEARNGDREVGGSEDGGPPHRHSRE